MNAVFYVLVFVVICAFVGALRLRKDLGRMDIIGEEDGRV
jgi:hypothetical protein